jgi:general secretion pathway protein G
MATSRTRRKAPSSASARSPSSSPDPFFPMRLSTSSLRGATRAFTIMEILVVLAIIGLLVGLVVSNTEKVLGRSSEDVAKVFVGSSLKTPLIRYRIDMGDYPTTAEGLAALVNAPSGATEKWRGPYIDAPGGKVPTDPWGQAYEYRYPGVKNAGSYDVYSKGPDRTPETADDIGNW